MPSVRGFSCQPEESAFKKKSTKKIGDDGEDRAVTFLSESGYSIVSRNWRTKGGEIDIIAQKGDVLVFAEVKTLPSGNLETLSHELDFRKRKRIIETSKFFLLTNRQYNDSKIRYDVLVVDMPGFASVYHIQDAFAESV